MNNVGIFIKDDLMVFNLTIVLQSVDEIIFVFTFRKILIADLEGHFAEMPIGNVSGSILV
jgi:hypothetical protein